MSTIITSPKSIVLPFAAPRMALRHCKTNRGVSHYSGSTCKSRDRDCVGTYSKIFQLQHLVLVNEDDTQTSESLPYYCTCTVLYYIIIDSFVLL
jgi:hypothetical protein